MSESIQPKIWGHIAAILMGTRRLEADLFKSCFESLANATLPASAKPDIHGLIGLAQEHGKYQHVPYLLSVLSGIDQSAMTRAAQIAQDHFDSPDYIPDTLMRDMSYAVNRELDEPSFVAMIAQATTYVLNTLIVEGHLSNSHIQPLAGFYIDPELFPVYKDQMHGPHGTYLAMSFALSGSDRLDTLNKMLFDVSCISDFTLVQLQHAVDRLTTQIEGRKPVTEDMTRSLLGLASV